MSKNIKIAILDLYNGHKNEGMRCIKMLLGEFLAKERIEGSFEVFNVRGEENLPNATDYDIYISTGGPGSPILENTKWEENYFKLIDEIILHNQKNENKIYGFFICHSFQLMIQHLKFGTITNRHSTSFGVMPVHKTDDGHKEWLFEKLEDPFWAVDSRDYQFISPNLTKIKDFGATILAIEKERPHIPLERAVMAIRFTEELFGTQFHPEADAEGMRRYFLKEDKKAAIISEHGEEKYFDMIEHLEDPDKIMFTESVIIPLFLENAAENILKLEMA